MRADANSRFSSTSIPRNCSASSKQRASNAISANQTSSASHQRRSLTPSTKCGGLRKSWPSTGDLRSEVTGHISPWRGAELVVILSDHFHELIFWVFHGTPPDCHSCCQRGRIQPAHGCE